MVESLRAFEGLAEEVGVEGVAEGVARGLQGGSELDPASLFAGEFELSVLGLAAELLLDEFLEIAAPGLARLELAQGAEMCGEVVEGFGGESWIGEVDFLLKSIDGGGQAGGLAEGGGRLPQMAAASPQERPAGVSR